MRKSRKGDGEVEDENKEITLTEARKIEPDYEVGEDVKAGDRVKIRLLKGALEAEVTEVLHER